MISKNDVLWHVNAPTPQWAFPLMPVQDATMFSNGNDMLRLMQAEIRLSRKAHGLGGSAHMESHHEQRNVLMSAEMRSVFPNSQRITAATLNCSS